MWSSSAQKIYSADRLLKCSPDLSDTKMKKDMLPLPARVCHVDNYNTNYAEPREEPCGAWESGRLSEEGCLNWALTDKEERQAGNTEGAKAVPAEGAVWKCEAVAAGGMGGALTWMGHRVNVGTRMWLEREAEPDREELVGFLLRGDFLESWELRATAVGVRLHS